MSLRGMRWTPLGGPVVRSGVTYYALIDRCWYKKGGKIRRYGERRWWVTPKQSGEA